MEPEPTPEPALTHGVGPWPGGEAEWPTDPHYDPDLLERGDTRNVIDRYRYWRMDAIVADLDEHRHLFHVAIENWQHDMNIGSIVRSANAFAADTVHIIGRRRWNKRGAMVTDRYQHVEYHADVAGVRGVGERGGPAHHRSRQRGGCRADRGASHGPSGACCCSVRRGRGSRPKRRRPPTRSSRSRQFGSTRSLNASAAAAIAMHSWVLTHAVR